MNDTIVAISTALGEGAISIIRVSGDDAIKIINPLFDGKDLEKASSHTINYGHIVYNGEIIDEVLLSIMKAPKTYTKEDVIEINTHGSIAVVNKIMEILLLEGCRLAEPGEFTKRAFLNGRISLMESESISDLLEAKTEKQAKMAMQGLTGKTKELIVNLREKMVSLLANIEVNIDYPEYTDELVITKENIEPNLKEIKTSLKKIINESKNGEIIKNGLNIAIIGRPNVGKSSLLNTLLEEDKAIVTDISGTTRDIVEGSINYKGILFNFIDTAGIRETYDVVEKIGVEKSKSMIEKADYTILVLNYNETLNEEEKGLLKQIADIPSLVFVNKIDLENKLGNITTNKKIIYGSTVSKKGIEELKDTILEDFAIEDLSQKDLTYLSNTRQISLAKQAMQKIENVIKANEEDVPVDMLAIDIKSAWEDLGKIIGEYYEEELVDNIFQRFCLGK